MFEKLLYLLSFTNDTGTTAGGNIVQKNNANSAMDLKEKHTVGLKIYLFDLY